MIRIRELPNGTVNAAQFEVGQRVKFRTPGDDAGVTFTVIEPRGLRMLVEDTASPMTIKPQFSFFASELGVV